MEGYLDVARAIEAGVTEAVATCGTALTGQHARLLQRFAETAVLNFDQDEAGQKAARKSLEVLLEEGMRVRIVELPEGHDPDTYLKAEGAEAYRKRLDEAPEAVEWLMRRAESAPDIELPRRQGGVLRRRAAGAGAHRERGRAAGLARAGRGARRSRRGGRARGAAPGALGPDGRPLGGGGGGHATPGGAEGRGPAAGRAVAARARGAGGGGGRDRARRADGVGPRGAALGGAPARGAGGGPAGRAGDAAGGRRRARRGRGRG